MKWLALLLASASLACASTGTSKDVRDLSRTLAEREGQLRASRNHENDLQIALADSAANLAKTEAAVHDLRKRLAVHVTAQQELEAERVAGARARSELAALQAKTDSLGHSSKEALSERLRACEGSIPEKERLYWNEGLLAVLKTLELREAPKVRPGVFSDEHYLHLEVYVAGVRLWDQLIRTANEEGTLIKMLGTAANILGITSALAPPGR